MPFEAKKKDPVLSDFILEVIDNSKKQQKGDPEDDIARIKFKIGDILCSDGDILRCFRNHDLEKKVPTLFDSNYIKDREMDHTHNGDCYMDVNIFNYLRIPDIQNDAKTYICFEVDDIQLPRFNENLMTRNITFRTVSHGEENKTDYGISRADLLGAIIKKRFDWTNMFGMHAVKVADRGNLLESGYYYREIVYQITTSNDYYGKINNSGNMSEQP